MKTLKKDIPVLLAAALFALTGLLEVLMLPALVLPAILYFLIAVALLRRRKDFFHLVLILTTGLLVLMQLMIFQIIQDSGILMEIKEALEALVTTNRIFSAGMGVLFVFVLLDGVDGLKKFRVFTGPLWFVPGALMLLADLFGVVNFALASMSYGTSFLLGVVAGLRTLTFLWNGPLEAVAVLLLSYWLYDRAPEELEPYLKRYEGGYIPEAELEEARRKLGLQKRKMRRMDAKEA